MPKQQENPFEDLPDAIKANLSDPFADLPEAGDATNNIVTNPFVDLPNVRQPVGLRDMTKEATIDPITGISSDLALVDSPVPGPGGIAPEADPIPKRHKGFKGGSLKSETAIGRIDEAELRQFKESFANVGLEAKTIVEISDFANTVFGPPEFDILGMKVLNPLNTLGKGAILGAGELGSLFFEGIPAFIETTLVSTGQALMELGVPRGFTRDLMTEVVTGLTFLIGQAGGIGPRLGVSRTPRPSARPAVKPQEGIKPGAGVRLVQETQAAKKLTSEQIQAAGKAIDENVAKVERTAAARTPKDPEISTTPLGDAFVEANPKTKNLPPKDKKTVANKAEADLQSARLKIGRPGELAEQHNLTRMDRFMFEALDSLAPIKRVILKAGEKLERQPDFIPFREFRLLNGMRGVLQAVHERGTIARTKSGDIIFNGKGLNEVLDPLHGKLDRAMEYFAGKRAQETAAQGRENLFTPKETKALLDVGLDKPLFETAFAELQGVFDRTLDFAVQSGLLSKESKVLMQEMNRDYIPFNRILEEGGVARPGGGEIFKRLKGGEANVNNILENIVGNIGRITTESLKNDAKVRIFKVIEEAGLDEFAVRLRSRSTPETRVLDAKVASDLEAVGVSKPAAKRAAPFMAGERRIADNIEQVFINGERVLFEVRDPYLLRSLRLVSPEALPFAVKILSGFKKTLTLGVTLSPDFMIRNLIRDTQQAFLQSRGNFIPITSTIRGLTKRLLKDADYHLNLANGGGFASTYKGDAVVSQRLQLKYREAGIRPENVLDNFAKLGNKIIEASSVLEESSRLAEFRIVRRQTGSLREAAASAREVSTDFAIRGANETVINIMATLPFANARLQGLVRIGRQFKDKPRLTAIKGLIGITIPTLVLYAINKDNPKYQALSDWIRDNHFVFIVGDTIYLAPKGFEAGALFGAVFERMFETIEQKHGKKFADAMLRMFTDTLSLNPIPQAFRPAIDLARNKNFLGLPIIPRRLEGVSGSEQFTTNTSETLVELARGIKEETGIELSPIQIENLIRGYFATMGMYALDVSDTMIRKAGGEPPTKRLDEIPFLRSFIRNLPLKRTQFESDFYDLLGEAKMLDMTLTKIIESARQPTISESEKKVLSLLPDLTDIAGKISEVSAAIRETQLNPNMTADQKRKNIDNLLRARNTMFEMFIKALPPEFAKERGIFD